MYLIFLGSSMLKDIRSVLWLALVMLNFDCTILVPCYILALFKLQIGASLSSGLGGCK